MANSVTIQAALTLSDMVTPEYQDSYSDMFKSLYGFRPRGAWCNTPEFMLSFFNDYDADIARELERDKEEAAERLVYLNHKHGRTFNTLAIAEQFNQQVAMERYRREEEDARQAAADRAEFNRRYSPMPVIDAWEHGSL